MKSAAVLYARHSQGTQFHLRLGRTLGVTQAIPFPLRSYRQSMRYTHCLWVWLPLNIFRTFPGWRFHRWQPWTFWRRVRRKELFLRLFPCLPLTCRSSALHWTAVFDDIHCRRTLQKLLVSGQNPWVGPGHCVMDKIQLHLRTSVPRRSKGWRRWVQGDSEVFEPG